MVALSNKKYVYIDIAVLQEDKGVSLIEELIRKRKRIIIYVKDDREETQANELLKYVYIYELVKGEDRIASLQRTWNLKKQKPHKIIVIMKCPVRIFASIPIDVISISSTDDQSVAALFCEYKKLESKKRRIVNMITLSCIFFYILYFLGMNWLPSFLVHKRCVGVVCWTPAILLCLSILYGIRSGLYRLEDISEVFDVFG